MNEAPQEYIMVINYTMMICTDGPFPLNHKSWQRKWHTTVDVINGYKCYNAIQEVEIYAWRISFAESQSTKHHAGNLFDNDRYELDGSFFATKASVTHSSLRVDTKTQHYSRKLLRSVKVYYTNDKFVSHGYQTNGQVDWYWVKKIGHKRNATPIHQSTNPQGSRNIWLYEVLPKS